MDRRSLILAGAAAPMAAAATAGAAQAAQTTTKPSPRTYVLVHGAWHGSWCWRDVVRLLRAEGHRVFVPNQTGLGQAKHLLSDQITLETFVDDVMNLIEMEELSDIVLVGHSFGGSAISGVADRARERIRHLVYLDSLIIQSGDSPFGVLPPEVAAGRRKLVVEQGLGLAIPAPPVSAFGIPEDHPKAAWVRRHLTPHPVGTYESPLRFAHHVGNGLPRTYVHCTAPVYEALAPSRAWVKSQPGWAWREIPTGHDAMVLAPEMLTKVLLEIGQA